MSETIIAKVRRLVSIPTKHVDVRFMADHSGVRFCVETQRAKPAHKSGGNRPYCVSVQKVTYDELERAADVRLVKAILADAHRRAVADADKWAEENL